MKEYILCAAIWFNDSKEYCHQPKGLNPNTGFVVAGRRHHNCYLTVSAVKLLKRGMTEEDLKTEVYPKYAIEGFLTNLDRFVGREEAAQIAWDADQVVFNAFHEIIAGTKRPEDKPKRLHSEHLY